MKVIVKAGQSLADIAIQEYGDVSAALFLAENNNLQLTGSLVPGTIIDCPDVVFNARIQQYCKDYNISPATAVDDGKGIFSEQFTKEFI